MPITDYIRGRSNRIVIGGTAGVGLIITAAAAVFQFVQPALRIENPDGERLFEVSTHGAIGVGTGASAFGTNGDCLTSGGGSGEMMSWGTCGSGGAEWSNTGALQTAFDSRFVNTSGDTMTGALSVRANISGSTLNVDSLQNCDTIDTDANGRLVCGTDGGGSAYTAGQGLTLNGTSFSVNTVLTGSLATFSTISGTDAIRSSGSLVWEGAASGASLWVSRFEGAGLLDCDASTQKLLWDTTTGRFSCGTDDDVPESGDFGAASDLDADGSISANAVSTSEILDGTFLEADLNAANTPTDGDILSYNSAGSNFEWLLSNLGTDITADLEEESHNTEHYAGEVDELKLELLASDCTDAQVLGGDGAGGAECQSDQDTTYTAGNGLTLTSTRFSLNSLITGSTLQVSSSLNSSGSLVWEGAASGASLWVSTFEGAGLTDCDLTSNAVQWDSTAKQFSCTTISSTDWSNTGALTSAFDARYVNTSGDTMTGALVIDVTGGSDTTLGLNVLNTVSGAVIRAQKALASSGSLVWEGAGSGSSLYVASSLRGSGLTDCDSSTSKLFWDTTTGRFSCGTDQQGATLAFLNVAVKNQSNVVADSSGDTLTLTGSRISVTTNASTDTVTFTGPPTGQGLSYVNGSYRLNSTVTGSTVLATSSLVAEGTLQVGDASGDSVTWNAGTMTLNNDLSIDSDTLHIDPTNNMVGIGTDPNQKLHVFDELNTAGIYKNILSVSSGAMSSNGNLFQLALSFECYSSPIAGVTDGGYCMGFDGVSQLRGGGTKSQIYGARYTLGTNASANGTVTTVYGIRPRILNQGAGNGSSITTGYQIYLDDIQATNGFAIYQTGANDINYFAGDTGFGTNAPSVNVEVRDVSTDGNIFRLRDSDGICDHNPEAGSETVTCSSDRNLKEDIRDASGAAILSNLMNLRIRDFRVKSSGNRLIGVIAQEAREVAPERVRSLSGTGTLGVQQPTVWELTLAIQELKREIDSLKSQISNPNRRP